MKKLYNWMGKLILKHIQKRIDDNSIREQIIKAINEKVNIPGVSEEQEQEIFKLIVDNGFDEAKRILLK